ncbi:Hcp family type VI secretion system effector [Pseudomonas putida]|uniref:Hcp family type VI secretion system effector n=1 Tax=Pseudomonas TaxID=286 RepID=UPI00159DA555|nr:Hcp family type VI secretion system effector [Pseudomonas putida]NVN63414.1 Hcp family type VI secretion system effector [Pseudomonas putida]NVN69306.1 Hcp family type VI secretion system effector [Pseudomonas putida]
MPTPAYIKIEGQKQGNITADAFTSDSVGNIYQEGHEDEILVQEVKHQVTVPTDPQSGQPAGQRTHKPFIFTSSLNKATPLMYQALASGEKLPTVEVNWYRTSAVGEQEHFFTTKLEDAIIVEINTVLPHAQNAKNANYTQLVEVAMMYRKITWTHVTAGTEGSDDWRKPIA